MEKTIRDIILEREKEDLSKFAFLTENTRGRDKPYVPCDIRTEFQRDRDKIIHCKAFRRMMHKTQVFLSPIEEHYRTRLTHTLEVTQIGRIICRALMLNEDLCEAACLGHDLGHTPFGHTGETALQECYSKEFTHYRQSLRVVEFLENNGEGLNLTWEVRDGIVNHQGKNKASTLEGIIVKFADRIAYINHDIDDSVRAGVLEIDDIPRDILEVLGRGHSERINNMVRSVISASFDKNEISMEPHVAEATNKLRDFLFEKIYTNPMVKSEDNKACELIARLFEHFVKYPEKMPAFFRENMKNEPVERCVCDYIAGMTDRHAIEVYKEIFMPNVWTGGK
ncbi:MAG: deoxyguanosinetriphosphate triphosphohydrolase [Clostridia bacterium]|nr:deoxyguanosinetriphosphate triphosphohydrolase [Clostridia bacterium]